ncbi:hypothetical protein FIV00_08705 [Labrenzia sp. THAF82]|uniref:hypothetical protein n=1 Tax=Labrenzia sp. THAF82 TaxID=2587861 RepID=UPI001268A8BA|nr:hypothetical protein [Labrenzia sp. THAF82]QFT30551.1 hypothetical protein FIV00_08705 [Labrenzia sp. THAF82]
MSVTSLEKVKSDNKSSGSDVTDVDQVKAVPARLQGRVDAFESGRLLGWAWDASSPSDRMTIHVFHDGERVLSKVAENPRVDLKRNGIGDGNYAFDIELPQAVASAPEGLTVIAETPEGDSQLKLPRPSAEERAAEAAVAMPLALVMEKVDRLIVAQRQSAIGQRDATKLLRETVQRIDALASNEGELGEALAILKGGQGELSQRVKELEVFLLRFDTTLKSFDSRLTELGDKSRNNLKVHLLLLAILLGFVGGMLFATAGGLWR